MKEEALRLADLMIDVTDCETSDFYRAGQMIRKLVEELDCWKLTAQHHEFMSRHLGMIVKERQGEPVFEESNEQVVNAFYKQFPKTKPLSDEEIKEIASKFFDSKYYHYEGLAVLFARALEERYGVK